MKALLAVVMSCAAFAIAASPQSVGGDASLFPLPLVPEFAVAALSLTDEATENGNSEHGSPAAPDNASGGEERVDEDLTRDADGTPAAADAVTSSISARMLSIGIPQPLPFLWELAIRGGIFMIPIALCSVVVMAYAFERRIGLRRGRIIPAALLRSLQNLNQEGQGIDPRAAWELCQKYESPVGRVLQAAILKVGRPQSELEKTVEDAVNRESEEMSQNLRPINVAASISPLLGLLGTVQGMIVAFMVISTSTSTGAAKGQELALGIYTALVTTFTGLCVAIPAIVIANMLEGRIERLLRSMEDVLSEVVPLFERFEGRWRVTRKSDASGILLRGPISKTETAGNSKAKVTERPVRSSRQPAGPATPPTAASVPPVTAGTASAERKTRQVVGTKEPS